jgi:hypothetical protein
MKYDAVLLRATTAIGIEILDIVDYPEAVIMDVENFKQGLSSLPDDQEIFCLAYPHEIDQLKVDYYIDTTRAL